MLRVCIALCAVRQTAHGTTTHGGNKSYEELRRNHCGRRPRRHIHGDRAAAQVARAPRAHGRHGHLDRQAHLPRAQAGPLRALQSLQHHERLGRRGRVFGRQAVAVRGRGRQPDRLHVAPGGQRAHTLRRLHIHRVRRARQGARPGRPQGGRNNVRRQPLQHTAHPLPRAPHGHRAVAGGAGEHVQAPVPVRRLRVPRAHHGRRDNHRKRPRGGRVPPEQEGRARRGPRALHRGRARARRRGLAEQDRPRAPHRDHQQRGRHRRARGGAQFDNGSPHRAPVRGQAGLLLRHL